jgi:DNA modification methylase
MRFGDGVDGGPDVARRVAIKPGGLKMGPQLGGQVVAQLFQGCRMVGVALGKASEILDDPQPLAGAVEVCIENPQNSGQHFRKQYTRMPKTPSRINAKEKKREVEQVARRLRQPVRAEVKPTGVTLPLNQIVVGDSITMLNNGPEGWADLVFADPPFNIGYLYHNYDDRKDVDEYVDWSEQWMRAVHRALKPTGSFYLAIGDEFVADLCVRARRNIGFHLRNWIIWHYTFGQQTKKMFAKSHTHILYFSKQEPEPGMGNITFNADAVRVKSARQTTYGDGRANPRGKLPDDTWFLRPQESAYVEAGYTQFINQNRDLPDAALLPVDFFDPLQDTWYVSRLCGTFKEREGWHGCQMPLAVLDRIIKASSNPGDVVLDPFNGSGTTVVSAALLGRQFVGIDQSEEYVKFARARLDHAIQQRDNPDRIFDENRKSRVATSTDAFGRRRVDSTKSPAKR